MNYYINVCAECGTQSSFFEAPSDEWVEACPTCLDSPLVRYPVQIVADEAAFEATYAAAMERPFTAPS